MAPLPRTIAKNMRTHFLLRVRKKIATLRAICGDPEVLQMDKPQTDWRKHGGSTKAVSWMF